MNANFYRFLALSLHFPCTFWGAQKCKSGKKMLKNAKKQRKMGLNLQIESQMWRRMGDSNPRARKGKRFSSFSLHLPMPPNRSFWAPFGHKKGIITAVLCAFVVQCARIRARTRENNRFLFSSQKVRELLFDKFHVL